MQESMHTLYITKYRGCCRRGDNVAGNGGHDARRTCVVATVGALGRSMPKIGLTVKADGKNKK